MISEPKHRYSVSSVAVICCFALTSCSQLAERRIAAETTRTRTYEVVYAVDIEAGESDADASIRIGRGAKRISELRFRIDPDRHREFDGDGEILVNDNEVTWNPPRNGGTLRYRVRITNRRGESAFDARVTDDWALFRADRVFPRVATSARVSAVSDARLELNLPEGWSALTPYLSGDDKFTFPFDSPERRFDRPTGWVLVGKIGVRRSRIGITRVAIGSPVGENFRRMDLMAFLNWTLPSIRKVFPTLEKRLVIVSAGDPMWRGGLSGPSSLYVHADRPLISENGTSTLLHELIHVAMGVAGRGHDDWLVEGLAEYYSIKILRTTETLNIRRMEIALEALKSWGENVDNVFVESSSGPVTARATTILADLDTLLMQRAPHNRSLDDVVARMIDSGQPYNYRALCVAAGEVMRGPVPTLAPERIPGAPELPECR